MPLTPNGKVDRKALRAPEDDAFARRSFEPPQGEIEEVVAKVWAELLGVDRIGRNDHFFELGGHSLLAVRMLERLQRHSLSADVRTLFAMPVLADFAASLNGGGEADAPANLITPQTTAITPEILPLIGLTQSDIDSIVARVPGGVANIQDIYGLSPLQDGILFHHLLAAEGDPYLLVGQMAFASRDLLDRYLAAVQQVIDRHDILRTSIEWEGMSAPAQVVWRQAPLIVTEVELDRESPAHEQLARRFDPRRNRIDLSQAPLLRFAVARDPGKDRWLLLVLLHHLIGDHSTLEVMHDEVRKILSGRGHELPAPYPFRNLVAQTRDSEATAGHERFFRSMLSDIDEPTTPFGLDRVHGDGRGVAEARRTLPQSLNGRLRLSPEPTVERLRQRSPGFRHPATIAVHPVQTKRRGGLIDVRQHVPEKALMPGRRRRIPCLGHENSGTDTRPAVHDHAPTVSSEPRHASPQGWNDRRSGDAATPAAASGPCRDREPLQIAAAAPR